MIDLYRNQLPKHAVESPANEDLATLAPEPEATNTTSGQTSTPDEPVVIVEPVAEAEKPSQQPEPPVPIKTESTLELPQREGVKEESPQANPANEHQPLEETPPRPKVENE